MITANEMLTNLLARTDLPVKGKIKAILVVQERTIASLAALLGLHVMTVQKIIDGNRAPDQNRRRIAEALGVAPELLWPELTEKTDHAA